MNTKIVKKEKLLLSLYIAGKTVNSVTAYKNLKIICDELLKGIYKIEVIDILKNPKRARENQILATPTLVRMSPLPQKNIIGDLSNRELILAELNFGNKVH